MPSLFWEFEREGERGAATVVALDRLSPPDFRVALLKSYGDAVLVQLVKGGLSGDPDAVFHLERRGFYELGRFEDWPPGPGKDRPRRLLMLTAYPRR